MGVQPPWNLTIRAPRFTKYVTSYNARFLAYDSNTLKATFQVLTPLPLLCTPAWLVLILVGYPLPVVQESSTCWNTL